MLKTNLRKNIDTNCRTVTGSRLEPTSFPKQRCWVWRLNTASDEKCSEFRVTFFSVSRGILSSPVNDTKPRIASYRNRGAESDVQHPVIKQIAEGQIVLGEYENARFRVQSKTPLNESRLPGSDLCIRFDFEFFIIHETRKSFKNGNRRENTSGPKNKNYVRNAFVRLRFAPSERAGGGVWGRRQKAFPPVRPPPPLLLRVRIMYSICYLQ